MHFLTKCVALGALVLSTGCSAGSNVVETTEQRIGDRNYILVDPANVSGPAPLVLALHGGFGTANWFSEAIPMADLASEHGFRVAYLEGTGAGPRGKLARSWNAGRCCGPAQKRRVDDMGYIQAVIDRLSAQGLVSEVQMFGHSNGAMMTYRYLCEGKTPVTAAVVLSGSRMVSGCNVKGSPEVLVVHGSADPNVPVSGGVGEGPARVNYTSLAESVDGLTRVGARVETRILPDAGHKISELDDTLKRTSAKNIQITVADFLTSK